MGAVNFMAPPSPKDHAEEALRAFRAGDFIAAAGLFGQSAVAYEAVGNGLDAAEMKNNQGVALLQAGDAQGSLAAVQGTAAVFFEHADYRRQGMALGNEASALEAMGRVEESMQMLQLAVGALELAGEDQLRARVLQQIASAQVRQGKYFEALYSMRVGLSGLKKPTLKQKILRAMLKLRL